MLKKKQNKQTKLRDHCKKLSSKQSLELSTEKNVANAYKSVNLSW